MTLVSLGGARPRVLHAARRPALVLVAHGSRDAAAAGTTREVAAAVRAARPELDVRLAYLGLDGPLLAEVLDGLAGSAVLVPLLLSRGYHAGVDLPAALAGAPQVRGVVAPPLGPDPLLAEALADRLWEAGWAGEPVVLAAAGSRDPAAAEDVRAQARLLARRLGVAVTPGYVAGAGPRVAEVASGGAAVAGYFTAPGDFARLAAAAGSGVTAAPLGAHPAVVRVLLERYAAGVRAVARTGGARAGEKP
ncbi:sirohydrochlorin cobaltochelatase [Kitasatospora sp. MMS16-BH015]|uniref:sirohydrochlorin chelatase n=1 Tax=Kitasatospora sp. MMS16-BH015 TaxID=2018025 RepID=UPI000CA1494D|nr:CbiX/SirB N-terminal domain-containing protein [Kitasatospora sp. MMS16-BH015]AUG77120.1 sirohydrochlorin cobaltochelatase [Kitasatospora sp. MMS16-BH015]